MEVFQIGSIQCSAKVFFPVYAYEKKGIKIH